MLMNFDLNSVLPFGTTITNAELLLTLVTAVSQIPMPTYGIHRIKSRWAAKSVTWACPPLFVATPSYTFSSPSTGQLSTDVTALVVPWVTGATSELGLLIKNANSFAPGTYIQAATSNAKDSDTWPRLKVDYLLPAVSIGTITPQFVNDLVSINVPASGNAEHLKDVSLLGLLTIVATNNGPSSVGLQLYISPDGASYALEGAEVIVLPGDTIGLVSGIFARYVRVLATDLGGAGANLNLYYQGQIG